MLITLRVVLRSRSEGETQTKEAAEKAGLSPSNVVVSTLSAYGLTLLDDGRRSPPSCLVLFHPSVRFSVSPVPLEQMRLCSRNRPCTGLPCERGSRLSRGVGSDCSRGNTGQRRVHKQRESDGGLRFSWLGPHSRQSSRNPRSERPKEALLFFSSHA